jgi:hypothetical protein
VVAHHRESGVDWRCFRWKASYWRSTEVQLESNTGLLVALLTLRDEKLSASLLVALLAPRHEKPSASLVVALLTLRDEKLSAGLLVALLAARHEKLSASLLVALLTLRDEKLSAGLLVALLAARHEKLSASLLVPHAAVVFKRLSKNRCRRAEEKPQKRPSEQFFGRHCSAPSRQQKAALSSAHSNSVCFYH